MFHKTIKPIQLEFEFCDKYYINLRQAYRCPLCGWDPKLNDNYNYLTMCNYLTMYCHNYHNCDFSHYSVIVNVKDIRRSEAQYILIHKWNRLVLEYVDSVKGKIDIPYPPT